MDWGPPVAAAVSALGGKILWDWLISRKPNGNGHEAMKQRITAAEEEIKLLRKRMHDLTNELAKVIAWFEVEGWPRRNR